MIPKVEGKNVKTFCFSAGIRRIGGVNTKSRNQSIGDKIYRKRMYAGNGELSENSKKRK